MMIEAGLAALPANLWCWNAVWRRNYFAWRKAAFASLLANLADPMIYLFGLGFGFRVMVGRVDGAPYIAFLAAGMVATTAMTAATFETIYGAFSRMHTQRMWEAMLCTQLTLGDVVLGELAWSATKALFAGTAVMAVTAALGYAALPSVLYVAPVIFGTGLAFASLAMILTAVSPSYDYFVFYQTLLLTPMLFLSGVIFPVSQLPVALQMVGQCLPLAHAVDLVRPVMLGGPASDVGVHLAVLFAYTALPFFVSIELFRRRLMS